jgi:hypothetical protein
MIFFVLVHAFPQLPWDVVKRKKEQEAYVEAKKAAPSLR